MGESDFHINVILYLRQALRYFFRHAEQTYVAANMFFYYEKDVPESRRAPDVFVVKGVSNHDRRVYKLWEEKVVPCVIFEISSPSTRLEDLGTKRGLYALLGVQEYFLFDPLDEFLMPRLQGFQLVSEGYESMSLAEDGTLFSQELGLILKPEERILRIVDPTTGEAVPTLDEAVEKTEAEAKRAETEIARLQAEIERLRQQLGEE